MSQLRPKEWTLPNTQIVLTWKRKNVYVLHDTTEILRLMQIANAHRELMEYTNYDRTKASTDGQGVCYPYQNNTVGATFHAYSHCTFAFIARNNGWKLKQLLDKTGHPCGYKELTLDRLKRVEVTVNSR